MANPTGSALFALLIAVSLLASTQIFKQALGESRLGTLIAGGIGSGIFVFILTAISNFEMANLGSTSKAGLPEVIISMLIAIFACAMVHRVAVTTCILFSCFALYLLNGISQARYSPNQAQLSASAAKKKK